MPDIFESRGTGLESPAYNAAEITPSDGADMATTSRALYLGQPGDLRLRLAGGDTVTFRNLAAGWVPVRAARIFATGTTASDIVAVW